MKIWLKIFYKKKNSKKILKIRKFAKNFKLKTFFFFNFS